jgi:hypothetical protein
MTEYKNYIQMKHFYRLLISSIILGFVLVPGYTYAGNKDRAGEAGAGQLLINPWARSNGLGGSNAASVRGLEAQFLNVAGIAHTRKTELIFSNTTYLKGTGTNIAAFGLTQRLGENGGVIGLSVVSFSYGDIPITTVDQPEGGIGTFSPKQSNINISYAKSFSHSIYGGINIKIVSESISNVKASTVAIDAGIQYITGKKKQMKFGVSLKNVGPNMQYSGDGLSFRGFVPGQVNAMTVNQRSASFELPSLIKLGMAYDFELAEKMKLTPSYTFTSNSFTNDQHSVGLRFSFGQILVLRAGYTFESDLFDDELRMTAHTGLAAGASVEVPINKEGGGISVDYAYQASNPYSGTHSIGIRIHL